MNDDLSVVDEQQAPGDAYRLERMDNGCATTIAIFYSAAEALAVLGYLDDGYRLMLGDKRVWPGFRPS
ncbi:hypothetical protein MesoLj131b_76810 (plasmid) [Mesorhizobium sp. 131-2-5]|uniref:hypothetical protein n=1 Tax=Mesorhizobium sp. 131-2-5 TaxID=2744519 RepID=UPI0018EBF6AB|nr:hypothetical protein [Mesorhizobium sp. 131-2-5]BCH05682.1 hypothetical protein MesoLj131b_76810 [Mesorhizobium sp. 131-2-5]